MADLEIKINGIDAEELANILKLAGLKNTNTDLTQNNPRFGFLNTLPYGVNHMSTDDDEMGEPIDVGDIDTGMLETADYDCGSDRVETTVDTSGIGAPRNVKLRITNNQGDNPLEEGISGDLYNTYLKYKDSMDEKTAIKKTAMDYNVDTSEVQKAVDSMRSSKDLLIDQLSEEFEKFLRGR